MRGIAHPPKVKSFTNRSFLYLLLRFTLSKRDDALPRSKQNKKEKVPLNIPKKRPNMDGGVTLETRRCQAKSAKLQGKKRARDADFVYAAR
jgi:hypothetical protein